MIDSGLLVLVFVSLFTTDLLVLFNANNCCFRSVGAASDAMLVLTVL